MRIISSESTKVSTRNTLIKPNESDSKYLLAYINDVLIPSSREFFFLLDDNKVLLHHAFSFNTILAHAIDYMIFIAKASNVTRKDFISNFDAKYYVDGCVHINNKFKLLDAINNSFKHVELDQNRYSDLIKIYGALTFHSLTSKRGKVFFKSSSYEFDYCRVVMRPIAAIFNCNLKTTMDIDDFINGRICGSTGYGHFDYDYEPHDAIDRMIDACNPECMDCGESHGSCDCTNFIYGNNRGTFSANIDPNFNFGDVMSNISGTREWSK